MTSFARSQLVCAKFVCIFALSTVGHGQEIDDDAAEGAAESGFENRFEDYRVRSNDNVIAWIDIEIDWSRIADANYDNRRVTVTVTDPTGVTYVRDYSDLTTQYIQPDANPQYRFPCFLEGIHEIAVSLTDGLTASTLDTLLVEPAERLTDEFGDFYRKHVYAKKYQILSTGFNYTVDWHLPPNWQSPDGLGGARPALRYYTEDEELAILQEILQSALQIYAQKFPDEPPGRGWLGNSATYNCQILHDRLAPILNTLVRDRIAKMQIGFCHWDIATIVSRGILPTGHFQHVYFGLVRPHDSGGEVSMLGLTFSGPLPIYFADPWRDSAYYNWKISTPLSGPLFGNDPNWPLETVVPWQIYLYANLDGDYEGITPDSN